MRFLWLPVAGVRRETAGELLNLSILGPTDGDDHRDHRWLVVLGDRSRALGSIALAAYATYSPLSPATCTAKIVQVAVDRAIAGARPLTAGDYMTSEGTA